MTVMVPFEDQKSYYAGIHKDLPVLTQIGRYIFLTEEFLDLASKLPTNQDQVIDTFPFDYLCKTLTSVGSDTALLAKFTSEIRQSRGKADSLNETSSDSLDAVVDADMISLEWMVRNARIISNLSESDRFRHRAIPIGIEYEERDNRVVVGGFYFIPNTAWKIIMIDVLTGSTKLEQYGLSNPKKLIEYVQSMLNSDHELYAPPKTRLRRLSAPRIEDPPR